ncbi:MAG: bifunctional adenosylcobinamide kinase/adenosylcobinamide-phosphate guanylyltransferase [Actinobacteria bacterium]|jgi:adenosylcobinamide kinase/adenosylcobinamide-phosphate guanylyltransferase|nr:bifunctional adenosylcobinamide kinase/adenosylcobinamide-phosphate guanylyltransferase [Actinomycetota bacterium]
MRTLVTGGVRSGKSAYAEGLLDPTAPAAYLACGPTRDDADWGDRVAAHRSRRSACWTTIESTDAATAIAALSTPALVDCLGTWLTAVLDDLAAWEAPRAAWSAGLQERTEALIAAWSQSPHDLVAVTNEVGWGVVSEHRSGRIFADELGRLNQRMAAASDRVVLVAAGLPLVLKEP